MSIIEKAVGKLEPKGKESAAAPQSQASAEQLQVRTALEQLERGESGQAGAAVEEGRLELALPLAELKQRGMVTPDAPRSKIAEEYRRIKRPLFDEHRGRGRDSGQEPEPDHGDQCTAG